MTLNTANPAVTVQFDTEDYDDAGFVNLASANTKITIPTGYAGRYEVGFYCYAVLTTTVKTECGIWLNGTGGIQTVVAGVSSNNILLLGGTTDIDMAVGDYIELGLYPLDTNGSAVVYGSAYRPAMWARKIR